MSRPRVVVVAQDLIWGERLARAVRAAGGEAVRVQAPGSLPGSPFVIVDLTAARYDGVEAVRLAAAGGAKVLAVGPHEDVELRKRALAAGASRVLAYRKLFEDGPAVVAAFLGNAVVSRT